MFHASNVRTLLFSMFVVVLAFIAFQTVKNTEGKSPAPAKMTVDFRATLAEVYGPMFADLQTGDIILFDDRAGDYKNVICTFVRWDMDLNMQVTIAGEVDPNQRILRGSLEKISNRARVFEIETPEHDRLVNVLKEKQTSMYSPYSDPLAVYTVSRK